MSDEEFTPAPLDTIVNKSEPAVVAEPAKAEPAKEPDKGAEGATPALDKDGKPVVAETVKPEVKTDDPIKAMRKALNATQRELAQLRQERDAKPAPPIDPLLEPEGFAEHIKTSVDQRILRERFDDAMDRGREDFGEEAFDEAVEFFAQAAADNPTLAEELKKQRKPDKFVWNYVKEAKARQELGDPVAYREKIRAETTAELMTKVDALVAEKVKTILAGKLPSSLADEQTQGGRAASAASEWAGPKPLAQIIARK